MAARKKGERTAQILAVDTEGEEIPSWEPPPAGRVGVARCAALEMKRLWEVKYQDRTDGLTPAEITLLETIGDGRAEDVARAPEDAYGGGRLPGKEPMPFPWVLANALAQGMEADLGAAEKALDDQPAARRCLDRILWHGGGTVPKRVPEQVAGEGPRTIEANIERVLRTRLAEEAGGGLRACSVRAVLAAARRREGRITRGVALRVAVRATEP